MHENKHFIQMPLMLTHISKKKKTGQNQATGISDMSVLVIKNFMLPRNGINKTAFAFDVVEQLNRN